MHQPQRPTNWTAEVWKGIGLTVLLHVVVQAVLWQFVAAVGILGIGLVQFLYLVPAAIVCGMLGRQGMVQGIVIAGAITFMLNVAACFGLVNGVIQLP